MKIKEFISLLVTTKGLATGITSLGDFKALFDIGFEGLASSIGLSTTALGGFIAVAAGIAGAIALFDHLNISADESREALSNMQSDYDDTKSNIESLNSELETTRDRIDELNAKENLSLVEQEELSKLQTQNAELERTLELEEARLKIQAQKLAQEAQNNYEEWTTKDDFFGNPIAKNNYNLDDISAFKLMQLSGHENTIDIIKNNAISGFFGQSSYNKNLETLSGLENSKDNINYLIGTYEALEEQMQAVNDARDELLTGEVSEDDTKQAEALLEYYNTLSEKSLDVQEYMNEYAFVMQEVYSGYENAKSQGIEFNDVQKQQYEEAKAFLTDYMKMYTGASEVEGGINTLLSKAAFVGVKDELIKAGETSRSVLDGVIAKTPGLTEALDEAGISAQQLGDYIMAIADPDSLRIDKIKQELKDAFETDDYEINFHAGESADAVWNEFISDKSDEEIEIFYKYVNDNGIDISKYSGEDLEATFTVAVKGQENLQDVEDTFSSILSSEYITKQVDDFQSNISSIKEALDALRSGDYDPSFITDLKQQFPSLSESLNTVGTNAKMQSDILSSACEGIEYYKNELRSALDLKIDLSKTIFGNVNTDDRQILQWTEDNLNVYKDALMSWADDSLTWDDVKSSLENSISTVFGGSSSYEIDGQEVEIAYTPILQTKEGAKLLDAHTVSEYIYGLIDKATEDGNWSKEELLSLDVEGLEFNGRQIQGLLADIGDTAIQTGEAMHYVGKNGSIASAYSNIAEKAKEVGMSVNEFIQASEQVSQHGEYINNLKSMLNGLAVDNFVSTMKSIKTAMEGVTDPTQLAAMKSFGEDLKKQLISVLDMSNISDNDIKTQLLQSANIDGWYMSDFQEKMDNLISEFGGTEEGRAGLITLAAAIELDPSLAYADYETLKAYVEDNKVIADIEFSQNRIEELQSQMTALQDEATKVQDSLSLKEANGVKPLVNDYQKLIKNSNQQVKNLQNQNAELRNQQTALKNLGLDETSAAYQEIESQINANVSAINQARLSQVEWNKTVDSLRYEPNEGLMAYNTAKSTRNAGDNYLDMLAAAKEAQEARQKGLIGTDDFKTVAEMFSPNGMDDATNWDENYGNITRYFTEDVTGVKNALNDLEDANLATQDSMGNWTYSIDDVQKSADTLGISFEAFLAIMGRLQDYGFTNDFFSSVEEGQEHISDLYTELTDAEQKMQELKKARDDGDTTVTDTVLASQEARVNQIKQSILESQDLLAQLASKDAQTYQAEQNAKIQSVLTMAKTSQQLDEQYVQGYLSNIQDTIEENGLEVDLKDLITINDDGSLAINWEEYLRLENQVGIPLEVTTEFKDAQVEEIKTKLTSAMEDGTSEVQSFVDTIAQYSSEQLGSITFGDGSYGEFEDAERAIDGLLSSLGLSQSEAQMLLTILAEMGKIEYTPEVSTEGVTEGVQNATSEAQTEAENNPVVIHTEIEASGETPTLEGAEGQTATIDITGNNEPAKQSATEAKEFGDSQSAKINVGADTFGAYSDVNKLIENVSHRFVDINVGANTFGLITDIDNALSGIRTINVHANVTVSTASGGVALGTAHANGTVLDMWNNYRASIGAYAKGNNWALPRNETALVNELGKFMLSINLFNCWKLLRVLQTTT